MIYKMDLKDSSDTMTFNLLETPIVDKDIEGAVDNVTLDGNQYTDYLYLKKQYIQKWAIMCPDEYDELRGFYTRQFEEGEVPSYRVYYGANVTRDYTFNGDYFQFNAEGIETAMTLSQLTGNAEQTTYSGKNLFDFGKFISDNVSVQGVIRGTATYTSNSITLTATSNDCFTKYNFPSNLYPVIAVSQNTDVTLSWKTNNTSGTNRGVVYVFGNNNGAATVIINTQDRAGYCTFNTGSYTEISFRVGVAASGDTLTYSDIQVEIGSAPTAYEKFVGGIPAPNPEFPQPISTVTGEQTITVTGKNLFDRANAVENSALKWADGGYFTEAGSIAMEDFVPVQEGMKIATNYYAQVQFFDTNLSYLGSLSGQSGSQLSKTGGNVFKNFTVLTGYNIAFMKLGYRQANNQGIDLLNADIMVNLGTTLEPYEPHQSQSHEINLGKNLLDINSLATAAITVSDGVATGQGQHFYAAFGQNTNGVSFIKRGGQLSISLKAYTDGNQAIAANDGLVVRVIYTDGTSAIVIRFLNNQTTAATKTYTTVAGKDVASIQLTYANDGGNIWHISELQIEKGGQATSYAPYFTPIELAKVGDYQDRIYNDDGKWYIRRAVGKVVLDGTENWTAGTGGTLRLFYSAQYSDILSSNQRQDFLSNNFHFIASGNETGAGFIYQQRIYLYWGTIDNTASDFKTWLSAHNTTVYYALATTTTTEITDETLLLQLNFLASLYKGANNISLVGTGVQGEMEVFIRDVMSVETDVVPEVPVRLTLTDDGVINACGCRRNVQLTMRETTE